MKFIQSIIDGCQIIEADIIHDNRGKFCKSFSKEIFSLNNINVNFEESYFSRSRKGLSEVCIFRLLQMKFLN